MYIAPIKQYQRKLNTRLKMIKSYKRENNHLKTSDLIPKSECLRIIDNNLKRMNTHREKAIRYKSIIRDIKRMQKLDKRNGLLK